MSRAAKPAAPQRPGVGRPTFNGEAMSSRTFRCTQDQWDKLNALGGSDWIRKRIDGAKDPR